MIWIAYGKITREGVQGMMSNPQNRAEAVAKMLEASGGKLISYYLTMNGDFDFFIVSEMPDDKIADVTLVDAMLIRGSGAIQSVSIMPAFSSEDAVPIMQRAQKMAAAMAYKPPAKEKVEG